jgi:hypothetical protein
MSCEHRFAPSTFSPLSSASRPTFLEPPRDVAPAPLDDRRPLPDEALRLLLPADFLAAVLRPPVDLRVRSTRFVLCAQWTCDLRLAAVFFAVDLRPRLALDVFFAGGLATPLDVFLQRTCDRRSYAPRALARGLARPAELAVFLPPDPRPLELEDPSAPEPTIRGSRSRFDFRVARPAPIVTLTQVFCKGEGVAPASARDPRQSGSRGRSMSLPFRCIASLLSVVGFRPVCRAQCR